MEDGSLRNIEKEILRECANKGIQVHSNFLNHYIKLLSLDPLWGIATTDVINRVDVQKFIRYVVSKLENQLTPSIIALKMQFYFNYNFHTRQRMLKRNRTEFLTKLKTLENEIVDVKSLKEDEEIDLMYRRIVYFITLASGLGNPNLEPVFAEVRTALGSILDHNEIKEFCQQPKYVKTENLMEFTKLVTGIRLFNKDCGKGGEGMEELPDLIHKAVEATNVELDNTLATILDKVNLMTTALDNVYVTETDERGRYIIVCYPPKGMTTADVEYVRDSLIVYRQHEFYIRKLHEEANKIGRNADQIFITLQKALVALHQVVKHRIAIPVNQVFPHFIRLSNIWCSLQDQTVLLAKMNQIMHTLQKYIKILSFNESIAEMMLPFGEVMTDEERLRKTAGQRIPSEDNYAMMLDAAMFKDLDSIKMEYLGFCAWKLVATEGGLIPGNPNLGIAKTMNMHFVFSTQDAGVAFGRSPEKFVMETLTLARRKPELIALLQLRSHLYLVQRIKELVIEPPLLPLTEDVEVQTETHPVQENIDRNYLWNVWDLRRKAIKLADMSHYKTRSCQTKKSYCRRNVKIQTNGLKEQISQTKRDNHSNVPKPSTFIFGLRGRKDDKQFIVDLTRPVGE